MEKRINFSENSCATNNSKTPLSVCPSSKGELGDQTRQKERYFDRGWIRPIKTSGLVPLSLYIHQLHYEARRFFAPCGPLIPFSRVTLRGVMVISTPQLIFCSIIRLTELRSTLYKAYESVHLLKKLELHLMSGYLTVSVKLIKVLLFKYQSTYLNSLRKPHDKLCTPPPRSLSSVSALLAQTL